MTRIERLAMVDKALERTCDEFQRVRGLQELEETLARARARVYALVEFITKPLRAQILSSNRLLLMARPSPEVGPGILRLTAVGGSQLLDDWDGRPTGADLKETSTNPDSKAPGSEPVGAPAPDQSAQMREREEEHRRLLATAYAKMSAQVRQREERLLEGLHLIDRVTGLWLHQLRLYGVAEFDRTRQPPSHVEGAATLALLLINEAISDAGLDHLLGTYRAQRRAKLGRKLADENHKRQGDTEHDGDESDATDSEAVGGRIAGRSGEGERERAATCGTGADDAGDGANRGAGAAADPGGQGR